MGKITKFGHLLALEVHDITTFTAYCTMW